MFRCNACSENPFQNLFGGQRRSTEVVSREKKKRDKKQVRISASRRDASAFVPRSEDEVLAAVEAWEPYVQPRVWEFFEHPEAMREVLAEVARSIDRNDDPLLSPEHQCIYWHGKATDDMQALIRMPKPNETTESYQYANRVLAFLFADEESFEQLRKLSKGSLKTSCNDCLCVHLSHILLDV